jgi:mannose-1-phosphate guanylyltransferase
VTRAAVILAGGAGTRLRPLSSDENPKQFLRLWRGASLIQMTWERLARLLPPAAIFVSTNEAYRGKCLEHLPGVPPENVITEPARRNTAPAIALCVTEIASRLGDPAIAFVPSDQFIEKPDEFVRVLGRAFEFAESSETLVTVGITPTEPHTGYGYLELGEPIAPEVVAIRQFREKPSREKAEEFLRRGNYLWNAGMFVWRASVFLEELARVAPEVAAVTRANYESMPSISIDYALMEKARRTATIRGDFGWSDVGSWETLRRSGAEIPEGLSEDSTPA